jgi:hypothetical protein
MIPNLVSVVGQGNFLYNPKIVIYTNIHKYSYQCSNKNYTENKKQKMYSIQLLCIKNKSKNDLLYKLHCHINIKPN